jgi:hypothetical protein
MLPSTGSLASAYVLVYQTSSNASSEDSVIYSTQSTEGVLTVTGSAQIMFAWNGSGWMSAVYSATTITNFS